MGQQILRRSAVALATALALAAPLQDAWALGLGRASVRSALGEPMRAEIEIVDASPDELSSLRAVIAPPEAYRSAGVDYNSLLTTMRAAIERRGDGRVFIVLSTERPVADPFVDLIIEASWPAGRIVRDFTLLFDPPSMRAQGAQIAPQVAATAAPRQASAPVPAPAAPPPPAPRAAVPRPAPPPPVASPPKAQAPAAAAGQQVTVRAGDTAGKIAAAHKPASISLDQMLLALLQRNPDAFVGGNINRVKAGAVLDLPSAEQASAVSATDARQTLVAQSRDFEEFRRRLAEGAPQAAPAQSSREAGGKVQARVEDRKSAASTPDRLTLSKGAVGAASGRADAIAKDRAAQAASARLAELNKNIADLSKVGSAVPAASGKGPTAAVGALGAGSAAASTAKAASAASGPASASAAKAASTPAFAVVPASAAASKPASGAQASSSAVPAAAPASAAASAASTAVPAAATASATAASVPAASAAPVPAASASAVAKAPVAPPPEPSFVDSLMEDPLLPLGGLLAVGGVVGLLVFRSRRNKQAAHVDSSFLESRAQPDSFFGASGGQQIDTNDGSPSASSMVYSPSQLDAAGDVDPVAEADVYLAYGRDLQAEEILKEAQKLTPQRVAIYVKLAEIYAKRRDARALEVVAVDAHRLTQGEGPEWERICELGRELDPQQSMYQAGGAPPDREAVQDVGGPPSDFGMATMPMMSQPPIVQAAAPAPELPTEPMAPLPTAEGAASVDLDLDLDFSLPDEPEAAATTPVAAPAPAAAAGLDFDASALPSFASAPPVVATAPATEPAPAASADPGLIEFDIGSLSLDLEPRASTPAAPVPQPDPMDDITSTGGFDDSQSDPLSTKLALAEEFLSIGDPDGARSLAEEVVAEASGDLKQRAQRLLSQLR